MILSLLLGSLVSSTNALYARGSGQPTGFATFSGSQSGIRGTISFAAGNPGSSDGVTISASAISGYPAGQGPFKWQSTSPYTPYLATDD